MKRIFRNWRRKVGCGALLLACVCMAGWLRSGHVHDRLTFERRPGVTESLLSVDGSIAWFTYLQPGPDGLEWSTSPETNLATFYSASTFKGWHCAGFGRGEFQAPFFGGLVPAILRTVPYWFVIVPVTLLSGYLLIFDPASKQSAGSKIARNV